MALARLFRRPASLVRPTLSWTARRYLSTDFSKLTAGEVICIGGKGDVNFTIPPTTTAIEALEKMKDQRIGCVVVVDGDGGDNVCGILTERDIMYCITSESESGNRWQDTPVSANMTSLEKLITVGGDDPASECLEIMAIKGFRHLPVVDADTQSLVGVLSMKDVIVATHTTSSAKSDFLDHILPRQAGVTPALRAVSKASQVLTLESGAYAIPHPAKSSTGGEDAHFMFSRVPDSSEQRATAFSAIGVADGVGSNSFEHGIDATLFPRALMSSQEEFLSEYEWSASRCPSPFQMLTHAWNTVTDRDVMGSSTLCIVAVNGHDQRLRAVNLGDSGFLVLRDVSRDRRQFGTMFRRSGAEACIVFRSAQQLHDFNWPVQIGRADGGDSSHFDTIGDAENINTHVQEGDLIVLATDGLFDNVTEDDIIKMVDFDEDVEDIAEKLAQRAFELSQERMIDSPFAILAKDHNIMWGGGRPDDISVIVSRVTAK